MIAVVSTCSTNPILWTWKKTLYMCYLVLKLSQFLKDTFMARCSTDVFVEKYAKIVECQLKFQQLIKHISIWDTSCKKVKNAMF